MLFDYTGSYFIDVNWGGCAALVDTTGGPACASVFDPFDQCQFQACALNMACNTQQLYDSCIMAAEAPAGACSQLASGVQSSCAADESDGGVLATGGRCAAPAGVLDVICGTGP